MLNEFIQARRKDMGITQEKLSEISGVGIRFIRDLEHGKPTVRLDKVNQVLSVFGYHLEPVLIHEDQMEGEKR